MAAAKSIDVSTLSTYFESLSDPRHTRNRKHLLVDVVVVAMCAILVGGCSLSGAPFYAAFL